MSGTRFITEAEEAHELLSGIIAHAKHKGSDDPVASAASAVGITYWSAWTIFKHRKKAIASSVLAAIRREYLKVVERQIRQLEAELVRLQEKSGNHNAFTSLAAEAENLVARLRKAREQDGQHQ